MRGLSAHRTRAVAVAALLPLAAAACTSTGGGGSPTSAVSASSTFAFPSGTGPVLTLQQQLDALQLAPLTTWSQTVSLTNGSSTVGTGVLSLIGGAALNSDGTLPATLSWTVNASGTGNVYSNLIPDPITGAHDVSCNSTSTESTCAMPVTLPAATAAAPADITLDVTSATPSGSTTTMLGGGMQIGSTTWGVGFITVPGASVAMDTTVPVTNQTVYNGTQTSCSAVPVSSVQWLSPVNEGSSGGTATYSSSSAATSTCPVTFTTLSSSSGSITGVQVTGPA